MPAEPVVAVVVAAGSGVRLGGGIPKALRPIAGRSVVVLAVTSLFAGGVDRAVVVVPAAFEVEFGQALAVLPAGRWCTVTGGADRQASVRRGLAAIASDPELSATTVVLIHDAARPLVPPEVVARVIATVSAGAAAVIPVVPVIDTIRQVGAELGESTVLDRTRLRAVQTPQGFDRATIVAAHALAERDGVVVTDDAMACEYAGGRVSLVEGARESHKITEPSDVAWAESLLAASAAAG